MFQSDLISLLRQWKHAGDKIVLLGNFNENVYTGDLATALSRDNLRMQELCRQIIGDYLPPTHARGSVPIDAVFCTAGINGVAIALLPSQIGVGDHRVFMINIMSSSMIGDVFPWALPASGRLLNCSSNKNKKGYIQVLNQLTA
jgi:hypothetical protein